MSENNKKLKESILDRLEREGITPHSKLYWLTYEYSLWGAWGISVALGAVALAILSFSSIYIGFSLFEATHDSFLVYLFEALPYLWLVAFLALIVVAYFNLKHTKRGYKYPLPMVIGSSFGFSILGAMLLHFMGVGFYLDNYLGEHLTGYQSRAEFEAQMWQNPMAGRLFGAALLPIEDVDQRVSFVDSNDEEWSLYYRELRPRDSKLLLSGEKVRVLVATGTKSVEDKILVACAVFPWLLDEAPPINKLKEDRQMFMEEMKEKRQELRQVVDRLREAGDDRSDNGTRFASTTKSTKQTTVVTDLPCSKHPLFRFDQ